MEEEVLYGGAIGGGMSHHVDGKLSFEHILGCEMKSGPNDGVDRLAHMQMLQLKLQQRMGYNFDTMTIGERTAFVKEFTLHAEDELHEVLREMPFFKPWKRYDNWPEEKMEDQLEKARDEFVDVIHFILNIALGLGMTADDIYQGYLIKNGINHDRQDDRTHYKGIK